jgi:hypothetical protein
MRVGLNRGLGKRNGRCPVIHRMPGIVAVLAAVFKGKDFRSD